ncbi:hypothetical protein EDD85DRAFT_1024919 [Armillaria nabsnona]|nr:hypothetical protein EDD85DRAFT_1024919 [Armillaria nabsnona]
MALSHVDRSCMHHHFMLFALSAQLSLALSTLVATRTLDIPSADSTSALRLSSYNPSHRLGRQLEPWLRTSATRMKGHLIHLLDRLIMVPPAVSALAFVFVSMIYDGARPYASFWISSFSAHKED